MMLTISGVSKVFGSVPVLQDISLDVPHGTRTALVGASGSGKSTLLRLVAGFERPDAGRILLGARALATPGSSVPAHRRGIGYVAQDGALFPHLTVAGNVGFGLPRGGGRSARVREVLELVALDAGLADRYPHQLSGGQQQRVALARALAPRPSIILLDEPFSALDTGLREQTRRSVIAALERSGITAILVTHDQEEALSFGQAIGVVAGGRLVQSGTPTAVFDDPRTADVAAFLGPVVMVPAERSGDAAECALGRIPVRHDRSDGARAVEAMIRPAQLSLRTDAAMTNAVVEGVEPRGPVAEVSLRVGDREPVAVGLRVPLHLLTDVRPGSNVAVSVDGGVVLYPAGAAGRGGASHDISRGAVQPIGV